MVKSLGLAQSMIFVCFLVLFNNTSRANWFSYHRLLNVKDMVILTDVFNGNPLSQHRLLFPISSKGNFKCTFSLTGQHMPKPLKDQLWTTGWKWIAADSVMTVTGIRTPVRRSPTPRLKELSYLPTSRQKHDINGFSAGGMVYPWGVIFFFFYQSVQWPASHVERLIWIMFFFT